MIEGSNRVLRGGSWNNNGRNVRSANRNRNEPANRNDNIGFRLALARTIVDAPFDQIVIRPSFVGGKNNMPFGAQVDIRSKVRRSGA
ncbi:MAG: SUMF1/EgtB/PvdO family nonheme iron enzyme [Methylococcales bacterium]|nr:SUMF1/EgtB/PvdO family nonheme iron enzyme [Methylococcales bacterium]